MKDFNVLNVSLYVLELVNHCCSRLLSIRLNVWNHWNLWNCWNNPILTVA